ncbi:MAG: hypothetical protein JSS81_14875 [Acidobacteria bacterium]|nr:hypothetical protein [Acidobacteriota bacterium]
MKKALCLVILLLTAAGLRAQERTLEKAEFERVIGQSQQKYFGLSYRETETSDNSVGNNKVVSKFVWEFAGRNARRLFYQFDSPTIKTKKEIITIGGKTYTRTDDGEWIEGATPPGSQPPAAQSPLETADDRTVYKSLGPEKLNETEMSVYASEQTQKKIDRARGQELFLTITTKYWIDPDGRLVRKETVMENLIKSEQNPEGRRFRHTRVAVWELDPNIRIEAPVAAAR